MIYNHMYVPHTAAKYAALYGIHNDTHKLMSAKVVHKKKKKIKLGNE